MTLPRPTVRLRLTLLSCAVVTVVLAVVLVASWLLMHRHFDRTLAAADARHLSNLLAGQYALALLGGVLIAAAVGWLLAGRALAPLRRITATARRVDAAELDERVAPDGPRDELRELGETIDDMLDRLRGSMQAQRRFVANASHELRSPLTVIRTEADVTLSDPDADIEALRAMGEVVIEASDRTDALLDGLLALARSQRAVQHPVTVDLVDATRGAVDDATPAARAGSVAVELVAREVAVPGDRALLQRLAGNLIDNGVRHNTPGGWVCVRVGPCETGARLRVTNSGPVVPADAVGRLTEPFERLGREHAAHAGLGLSIVQSVVGAHGGSLDIAARREGGLQVEVVLPAASEPVEPQAPPALTPA